MFYYKNAITTSQKENEIQEIERLAGEKRQEQHALEKQTIEASSLDHLVKTKEELEKRVMEKKANLQKEEEIRRELEGNTVIVNLI